MTDDAQKMIDNYNDDIESSAKSQFPCLLSNLEISISKMSKNEIKSTWSMIGLLRVRHSKSHPLYLPIIE